MNAALALFFSLIAPSAEAGLQATNALPACSHWKFTGFGQFSFAHQYALNVLETETMYSRWYGGLTRIAKTSNLEVLLPKTSQKVNNTYPKHGSRANCFNATLNWFGQAKIGYSEDYQIEDYLLDEFIELENGEEIRFGDVITLYELNTGTAKLFHSAVYVDSGVFWHKASVFEEDPWTFQDLTPVLDRLCGAGSEIYIKFYRKK